MRFVSLFSGAGGLDLGFILSGWEPVFMADNWKPAIETLEKNHPDKKIVSWDLANVNEQMVKDVIGSQGLSYDDVDCVIGGPPCQPFSRLNQNQIFIKGEYRDENLNDPRRSLFMSFLRIVGYIKPKIIVMENVFDLANRKLGGEGDDKDWLIIDIIIDEFNKLGYNVKYKVLKTTDYGVPQRRKRLIFIGTKTNKTDLFPPVTELLTSVKKEFTKIKSFHPNQNRKKHSKEWLEKARLIPQGGYYNDLPLDHKVLKLVDLDYIKTYKGQSKHYCIKKENGWIEFKIVRGFVKFIGDSSGTFPISLLNVNDDFFRVMPRMGTYLRRIRWDVSHTVTRNPLIHPEENREITIREKASIQTFPPEYEFIGKTQDQHILVGNAVPVNLGKAIAKHIERF